MEQWRVLPAVADEKFICTVAIIVEQAKLHGETIGQIDMVEHCARVPRVPSFTQISLQLVVSLVGS